MLLYLFIYIYLYPRLQNPRFLSGLFGNTGFTRDSNENRGLNRNTPGYVYSLYIYIFMILFVIVLCIYIYMCIHLSPFFFRSDSGHQRPPAQLGALRGLRRNQARRRRLGDEFAPGGESERNRKRLRNRSSGADFWHKQYPKDITGYYIDNMLNKAMLKVLRHGYRSASHVILQVDKQVLTI